MTSYVTVARPYARAVFNTARVSDQTLLAWDEALEILAIAVSEPAVIRHIFNPRVSVDAVLEVLQKLVAAVISPHVDLIQAQLNHFISLLIDNRRVMIVPDILLLYRRLIAQQKNRLAVKVSSAYPLDTRVQDDLKAALTQRFHADVQLECCIDPSLLGGLLIRADDWVIDGSVRTQLKALHRSIIAS